MNDEQSPAQRIAKDILYRSMSETTVDVECPHCHKRNQVTFVGDSFSAICLYCGGRFLLQWNPAPWQIIPQE